MRVVPPIAWQFCTAHLPICLFDLPFDTRSESDLFFSQLSQLPCRLSITSFSIGGDYSQFDEKSAIRSISPFVNLKSLTLKGLTADQEDLLLLVNDFRSIDRMHLTVSKGNTFLLIMISCSSRILDLYLSQDINNVEVGFNSAPTLHTVNDTTDILILPADYLCSQMFSICSSLTLTYLHTSQFSCQKLTDESLLKIQSGLKTLKINMHYHFDKKTVFILDHFPQG